MSVNKYAMLLALIGSAVVAGNVAAEPVLLITIDGLRPGDVLEAQQRGLEIPTLRRLVDEGAWATGVKGVIPTITSPSHIALITGASPARHGIYGNAPFDPEGVNPRGYYNYARDIEVGTLWDAVHQAGGKVASIAWPASTGARTIDYNLVDFQPSPGMIDNGKLMYTLATSGLPEELEQLTGEDFITAFAPPAGNADLDETRTRFGIALLKAKRPRLMTFHYSTLDGVQHQLGAGTTEAHATLERTDRALGTLVAAAREAQPDTVVVIASDHGFANIAHRVNLAQVFADHGLITRDPETSRITAWDAVFWGPVGGVVLARPDDPALRDKVATLLADLQRQPELGIQRIIGPEELRERGAPPMVTFVVDFKPGYVVGGAPGGGLVQPGHGGAHGYFHDMPEMNSTFIISGPTLDQRGSLGIVDMRDIAPTLARILGVTLPDAEGKPIF